jgi:succinate-semialdehyde dehydrogenase/glutarate-semialdehyde dehydrogenase
MVAGSLAFGSELVYGGKRPSQLPYFTPTVLRTSSQDPLLSSEIFGPVAPVVAFDDEEEAIDLANAVDAGLAAYVVSRDVRRALALAERLDVGMVGINRGLVSDPAAPFGGMKASGVGREGGREGIDAYLELQYIALDP